MNEDTRDVARVIKRERERAGLSKVALSKIVGVSRPTLISIEMGRAVNHKNLKKVCDFFALDIQFRVSKR